MGVTVSYKGSGGSRAFNLDGVPTGDAAKALGLPKKKHFVPQTLADALKMPQPEDPIKAEKENKVKLNRLDMNPGTLEDKVLPGGGVVVSQRGVCLRGEEDSPLVTGTKLFGSVKGAKGYHTIDEIDPPGNPRHVGAQNADEDPAPNNEAMGDGESCKYQVMSRLVVERDPIAKLIKFYELDKDVSKSPAGRTVGVTKERRRMVVALRDTSAASHDYVHPYEVRWSPEDESWAIWFPGTTMALQNALLMVGHTYVSPTGIAASQNLPAGWYTLPNGDADGFVWLNVTVPQDGTSGSGSSSASAVFATQAGTITPGSGYMVYAILVAKVSTDAETSRKTVVQYVDSFVKVPQLTPDGDGGGGGGGGGDGYPEPFDIDNNKVVRCKIPAPVAVLTCNDYTIDPLLGDIYVHVDRSSSGYMLSVDQTFRNSSAIHAQWTLYNYANGNVTCDCRPKVLPLFDLT